MNLLDMIERTAIPAPWSEGEKIPWDEPGFSERMLKEHLSQEHDAASRRTEHIDAHVDWIHRELLGERPARVLDLGCGPGLGWVTRARGSTFPRPPSPTRGPRRRGRGSIASTCTRTFVSPTMAPVLIW
jgi:hypothetical protein